MRLDPCEVIFIIFSLLNTFIVSSVPFFIIHPVIFFYCFDVDILEYLISPFTIIV